MADSLGDVKQGIESLGDLQQGAQIQVARRRVSATFGASEIVFRQLRGGRLGVIGRAEQRIEADAREPAAVEDRKESGQSANGRGLVVVALGGIV